MRNPFLLLAMFGMASVVYPQAQAAPVQFAGVVPGTVVTKEVQSIRERRFENLVEQETDFSCGAASLATILKYAYGWTDVTEETVLVGLMEVADPERVRQLGFSLLDLNNYVQSIGLRGRGYEIGPESLDEVSIPVIVLLDLDGYEHFVVMKKARGDRVYIGDPALGNKVMDRDDFLASWNNIIFAVVGDGFDTSTVLLDPAQPLTARRMTDVFSPVPEQQLLDFGFKHSEVF
ncbi:C39 family peptidase [Halomonas daqingensis]|uniref:C39 family peptidase n=2 Tax=Billgrantia desiderata TaxID=52021 RepID=A0ABS9BAD7_9GAMM|nr:C39 family peptidase [Halomonas desiderata]OUE41260.1 peptidase C39 [Halomonas desiderata SP1]MCE8010252.1 C39 family peptidase [Halomonas desiderata]MCE8029902.1 C39 family peptidase [Halomonas desiderata]MCE8044510.1 C39 family peptidase [Halomonas desiderata]MCE8049056.1 C39 family peptidase [Halomonas desiderata]